MQYSTKVVIAAALIASTQMTALSPARAEIVEFEIKSREPAYEGRSFGDAGAYEKIEAIAHFAIDPVSERGRQIVDLDKASLNDQGKVSFSSTVTILAPVEQEKSARTIFYEVPNRGRNLSFPLLNMVSKVGSGFTVAEPGDGFLMSQGLTVVWGGWQTGLGEGNARLDAPILTGISGQSREEFIFDDAEKTGTGELSHPAADMDPSKAVLTVRRATGDDREQPEALSFRYIDENSIEVTRPDGYDGGAIYEFIYPAKDPVPAGLGFIATADLISFLRGNGAENVERPIGAIDRTIAIGISQSGRFLRDFIYQGFNADSEGKKVFDGVMAHIAGSRKTFTNYSFSQAGRFARQHEDHDFPGDQFPFTYADTADPVSGRTESILTKCTATESCPKINHSDTSTEFWQGRASLISTGSSGEKLEMPDDVRLYFLAGVPHYNAWMTEITQIKNCKYPKNPLSAGPTMRALTLAMQEWISEGNEPPESVYPAGDDLVLPGDLQFPLIDGERPTPPVNSLSARNYDRLPPEAGKPYDVRVPRVDENGTPQGGIEEIFVAAPLGSYWGWNLRAEGYAPGNLCGLSGSFIAFPDSAVNSDSRKPLLEHYADAKAYQDKLEQAADDLIAKGLMLREDKEAVLSTAPVFPAQQ